MEQQASEQGFPQEDGVVMTHSHPPLKQLADKRARTQRRAEAGVMSAREPLLVIDSCLQIQLANASFHALCGTTPEGIRGYRLVTGMPGTWPTAKLPSLLQEVRDNGKPLAELGIVVRIANRGVRGPRLGARAVRGYGQHEDLMLLTIEEVAQTEPERPERPVLLRRVPEVERAESLTVLTGSIAHAINNILTPICGHASLLLKDLPPSAPEISPLTEILASVRRAANLCDQMLTFSGIGRFHASRVDVSDLVREFAPQLRTMIRENAELHCDLMSTLPTIEADVQQIRQVVTNLVVNASESLQGLGGHITIRTGILHADRAALKDGLIADVAEGEYVLLEVTDNGQGMSVETQAHIFEPFFTTRFAGRGLGLAVVLGIIRRHRGKLRVESQREFGSTFSLLLPRTHGSS